MAAVFHIADQAEVVLDLQQEPIGNGVCVRGAETRAGPAAAVAGSGLDIKAVLAWAAVGIPLAWGIWITLEKALVLFR